MKRRSLLFGRICTVVILLVLVLSLGIVGCTTPDDQDDQDVETFTLRYADYRAPVGYDYEITEWMLDEITQRTDGRVQFERYWGESLLTQREMLGGIQDGAADMGWIPTGIFSAELPLWSVGSVSILGPTDPAKQFECAMEIFDTVSEIRAQLEQWNQTAIALEVHGRMMIGGVVPVTTLDDIKGMRVRCAVGIQSVMLERVGASTIYLPAPEVYSALEKGALDLAYSAPGFYDTFALYELEPAYVTIIPLYSGGMAPTTINLDTWNSLPADVQEIISEVGQEFSIRVGQEKLSREEEMMERWESFGAAVHVLSMEQVEMWADLVEEELEAEWVERLEEMGQPGAEVLEAVSQIIDKYR